MSAITDADVVKHRLDLEMLERPHLWPGVQRGMRCVFVKRGRQSRETGPETGPCFLVAGRGGKGAYLVIAHDWSQDPVNIRARFYDCAQQVVDSGWVVD